VEGARLRLNLLAIRARVHKLARKMPPRCPPLAFIGAGRRVDMLAHPQAPRGLRGAAAEKWLREWETRCART